jgi:SAM-dependent methyltransferase
LKAAFPASGITACDLDVKAVEFSSRTFNATPVNAMKDVSGIEFKESFDLIWVGSLLTHLAPGKWPRYLSFFESALSPRGVLLFTMHGRYVAQRFISGTKDYGLDKDGVASLVDGYNRSGCAFAEYTIGTDYGISVANSSVVLSILEKMPAIRVLLYNEKGWVKHQDVIGVVKENLN